MPARQCPQGSSCYGGSFQALRGRPMGGAVFVQSCNIVGTGATVIQLYGKPLQKPCCPSQRPGSLYFPPGSQAHRRLGQNASASPQPTCQAKAMDKDRWARTEASRQGGQLWKNASVAFQVKDAGRPLHPSPHRTGTRPVGRSLGGNLLYKGRCQRCPHSLGMQSWVLGACPLVQPYIL